MKGSCAQSNISQLSIACRSAILPTEQNAPIEDYGRQSTRKSERIHVDIAAENRARLKQLFPTIFTETRNDKGELTESVDFEKL